MKKHIANMLTGCRILGSVLLLIPPAFSPGFYAAYLLCGISDMIDGTVARMTKSSSKFGSRFDSAADLIFTAVCLFKLLPAMQIPLGIWIWCGAIALIKISTLIWGYVLKKQFLAQHTVMNKITGFALFLLPLAIPLIELKYLAPALCSLASFSAAQETVCAIKDCK